MSRRPSPATTPPRFQAATGVPDSPERFVADLREQAGEHLDLSVARRLCGLSAELVHWLVDEAGVRLSLTLDYRHIAHSVNRLHNPPSREGAELISYLEITARQLGVHIVTSAPVTDVRANGATLTIEVDTPSAADADRRLEARTVILATDGFGASVELLARHAPDAVGLPYFGSPANTGGGLLIGERMGGRIRSMNSLLGYAAMAVPAGGAPSFETMFSWTVVEKGGIVVDGAGRRFADESVGYSAFVDDVIDATGTAGTWAVFDQRILDHVTSHEQRFALLADRADTPILRAQTSAELARLGSLDPEVLTHTLDRYGVAARREHPDDFGRADFGSAPLQPPYYTTRTVPGFFTTQGGLEVDDHARVLSAGRPIPNLYAGGGTAAGISGPSRFRGYVSGNGLLSALGYGYLAGAHAARSTQYSCR